MSKVEKQFKNLTKDQVKRIQEDIELYQIQNTNSQEFMICSRRLLLDKLALEDLIKEMRMQEAKKLTTKAMIKGLIDKL